MSDGQRSGRSTGRVLCKSTELKRCSMMEMRWKRYKVSLASPVLLLLLYFFHFKPTSTKPQDEKIGETYKIMAEMAIYSVTMVLRKETAFRLYRAMERCWKRNVISRASINY